MTVTPTPRVWVVIPAAGVGSRFGGQIPKQYCRLGGITVIEWTLRAFAGLPGLQGTVVAIASQDAHWSALEFADKEKLLQVAGGAERADSVHNALKLLATHADADDFVMVHDAARPCVSSVALQRLIEELADHPCGGLLAVPVADTLKLAGADGDVIETRDRSHLWQAQTPQMFRLGLLQDALTRAQNAGHTVTDESSAMELAGHTPRLVAGEPSNLKITQAQDLILAARILGVQVES